MAKKKKETEQNQGASVEKNCLSAKRDGKKEHSIVKTLSLEDRVIKADEIKKEMDVLSKKLDELNEIENRHPLNEHEKTLIKHCKAQKEKTESQLRCDTVLTTKTKNGNRGEQYELVNAALYLATGASDLDFSYSVLTRCIQASGIGKNLENKSNFETCFNSITNAMTALNPQDEIEGMLISRLVALHFQGIYYLACSANKEISTEGIDNNINRSTKLSRLYNETLEALMRYRRKGEQKVIVQHVNVNDGGKAIVNGNLISERGTK